jgi:predicted ATPase
MENIRVRNLRCLADSTSIEIKPISLLVGANSSGKSTFLRIFPLLKQSHEMRTLGGLVLNEGDVNFGFFNDALHKDADPAELKIEFGFTMQPGVFQGASWNKFLINPIETSCELTYVKRAKDPRYARLRIVRIFLQTAERPDVIEIYADEEGKISKFRVNDFQNSDETSQLRLRIGRGLVPSLVRAIVDKDSPDSSFDVDELDVSPFDELLLRHTESYFHGRTSKETRLAMFNEVQIGSPQDMLDLMRNTGASTWQERVQHWTIDTLGFRKVRDLLLARGTNDLLNSVSAYVTQLSRSVHYFQPVRANVQRDYLSRDVSVTSVDPSGLNVAMVLASLPNSEREKFREWMRKYFGMEVFPQSVGDGARIALRMKMTGSGTEYNLADTGFGFSQMLPFLVQIWSLVEGKRYPNRFVYGPSPRSRYGNLAIPTSALIAIEQPELHLHPALQAKLADVIVAMARLGQEKNLPIRFMLETHSPTIIERIGQRVENHDLSAEDVQVVLFELDKEEANSNTAKVRSTSFDSQGVLRDWPFGFLSAPISVPE